MNKKEYIDFVENNEELNRWTETISTINTLVAILVNNNICTIEDFNKIKQQYKKQLLEDSYKREKKQDLSTLKKINDFYDLLQGNDDNE